MKQYLDTVKFVLENGTRKEDRTGVGTISCCFTPNMVFDLQEGFPLLTTKKLHTRSIFEELIWFLSGSSNNRDLQEKGVSIWDEWQEEDGELGPIYGFQWRHWGKNQDIFNKGIDQISHLIDRIKHDPFSRRHIVSAWNVSDLDSMALPPCHCFFQVFIVDGLLNLSLYQRSCDLGLGVPFNIASYALLTHMLAAQTGYEVGKFIHHMGDAHIYLNHIEALEEQLSRETKELPCIALDDVESIFHYDLSHIHIYEYNPHPHIKMEVAA